MREQWKAAVASDARVVTVTSYNEWGEGTQIEPATPFTTDRGALLRGYGETDSAEPDGAELMYVELVRELAAAWKGIAEQAHEELR